LIKQLFFLLLIFSVYPQNVSCNEHKEKFWIYFIDKGPVQQLEKVQSKNTLSRLSAGAIARRKKVMPAGRLFDEKDMDLYIPYLLNLADRKIVIVNKSRWLNAVTARLSSEQVKVLTAAPFVKKIVRVRAIRLPETKSGTAARDVPASLKKADSAFDYGNSQLQIEQMQVDKLHKAGIWGDGVRIGILDTGFKFDTHEVFANLNVADEYDFVFDDNVTSNQPGDMAGQISHGTRVLSVIGGFMSGSLIGPAFNAEYYLAKTEDIRSETRVEEDNWAAAIEWMEEKGVDVATSSLGYFDFDDPAENYTYQDLDGETTVISRAAGIAVERGMVVLTSAGNSGTTENPFIGAPADAKGGLAVGAVDFKSEKVGFSSIGPTADGRIKPDLAALGQDVYAIDATSSRNYQYGDGTSFACPLVAGVAALILSAHPQLTPAEVGEALKNTASQSNSPDNLLGYGIVNAHRAITYWKPAMSNKITATRNADGVQLSLALLKNENEQLGDFTLYWRESGQPSFTSQLMQGSGDTSFVSPILQASGETALELYLSVRSSERGELLFPHFAPDSLFIINPDEFIDGSSEQPDQFELTGYPNPWLVSSGNTVKIKFAALESGLINLKVVNVRGQLVRHIVRDAERGSGEHLFSWDGKNQSGSNVAAGIYFYLLTHTNSTGKQVAVSSKVVIFRGK